MRRDLWIVVLYSFMIGTFTAIAFVSVLFDKPGTWLSMAVILLYSFLTFYHIKEFTRQYKEKE